VSELSEQAVRESVKQQLAELLELAEKRASELEAEAKRSRDEVTQIRRAVKALDGTHYVRQNGKPKASKSSGHKMVGEAKLQAIADWLQAHRGDLPETFTGSEVYGDAYDAGYSRDQIGPRRAWPGVTVHEAVPRATLWAAMPILQERGVIRLDRVARVGPKRTQTKIYALV